MCANLTSGWNGNGEHRDGVGQVDSDLLGLLIFHFRNLLVMILTTEEILIPFKRHSSFFSPLSGDKVYDIVRLQNFDQKDGNDVAWVIEKTLVVFLSLENID